ncbi:MAG: GntR family transcriptional regulator [Deltaproteobacteria bacterium]|jgi:DNA-binding GntR family transcriptional regulator|nr:GntR family transcriptional regulator [Deltaproteobacteria bacterium]
MPPIDRTSLVDQLYDRIKNNIINLTYPMGSKLNVNDLQTHYGVSSTPLREAITRLQAEGLVTYENNVGAKVISLEPKDVDDIHGLVLTLHKMAVTLAMEIGDHEQMADKIDGYVKAYKAATTAEGEVQNIADLIGTFYRHCGNTRLDTNMHMIQGQQLLLRFLFYTYLKPNERKQDDYAGIAKAVRAGDTDTILKILTEIYRKATIVLHEALASRNDSNTSKKI